MEEKEKREREREKARVQYMRMHNIYLDDFFFFYEDYHIRLRADKKIIRLLLRQSRNCIFCTRPI